MVRSSIYRGLILAALLANGLFGRAEAQSPILSGTVVPSANLGTVDLTAEGTLDWAHWGYGFIPAIDQKADSMTGSPVGMISDEQVIDGGYGPNTYDNNAIGFSWSDGTPDPTVTEDTSGIYTGSLGAGFQISVPADTTRRLLRVYVGGYLSGGTLTASISDGSSATYTNSDPGNTGFGSTGESYYVVYLLTYSAASAGQTLTVTWTQSSGDGNVTLQAATLSLAPTTPPASPVLSAVGVDTRVVLSWNSDPRANSYNVYRSPSPNVQPVAGNRIASGVTGTTYIDPGLTLGTTYHYVITGVNTVGEGAISNEVAIKPVSAPVIAIEEFDYPVGNLDGLDNGTGWADIWYAGPVNTITSPGLTFGSLQTAGNTLTLGMDPNFASPGAFRTIATREGSANGTNTVYMSYLARLNPANTGIFGTDGYAGIDMYDGDNKAYFTGIRWQNGNWGIESEQNNQGGVNTGFAVNTTVHFFVFKFDFTPSSVTVSEFVDPTPGENLPATADATQTVTAFNFDNLVIGASGPGSDSLQIDLDELRIGRTYATVAPKTGTTTVSGKIALEGVNSLTALSAGAPLGTFHVSFRTPNTTTEVFGANVTLTPVGTGSPNGTFTVSGVPAGTYDVTIKGSKSLRAAVGTFTVGGTLTLPDTILPAGDANNDNHADIGDFGVLVNAYETTYNPNDPNTGYDPAADFNYDGSVNIGDFGLLVNEFGVDGAP